MSINLSTHDRISEKQDKKFGKLSLSKCRMNENSNVKSIVDPDITPVTPENEVPKKSLKSKLNKINSCSIKLKKSKLSSLLKGEEKNKSSVASDLSLISPIQKTFNNSRKLSLKKPLKRRCSYSLVENGNDKKGKISKIDKKEKEFTQSLSELYAQNGSVSEIEKVDTISQLTNVKEKKKKKDISFGIDNDSFNDILHDSFNEILHDSILENPKKKKVEKILGGFDLGDSIIGDTIQNIQNQHHKQELLQNAEELLVWVVTNITLGQYGNSGSQEKLLFLQQIKHKENTAMCHLRDDWFRMEVDVDDLVLVSNLDKTKTSCVVDNASLNYVTLFPNTLISGTTIATGITCERQAVLNEQFKTDFQNEAMVVGTITHDLFEWALQNLNFKGKQLEERLEEMLQTPKYVELLYQLDLDIVHIKGKLSEYVSRIKRWPEQYLKKEASKITPSNGNNKYDIKKIVDIEENIWSPYYGFKGKVDVSVEVTLHRKPQISNKTDKRKDLIMALELKTGKMMSQLGSVEHRAQVAVYCILMSERYNTPIDSGLLYYIKTNHMENIPLLNQEKRALLIKRNEIARKLTLEKKKPTVLPDLLRRHRVCKYCPQNHTCMLHHKARESGTALSSGVEELYKKLTDHLKTPDLKYFSKWYELSLLEAQYDTSQNKEKFIWTRSPVEREKRGSCFSGMELVYTDTTSDSKYHCHFERKLDHFNRCSPLNTIPLVCGDRVIISQENKRVFNQTTGYIKDVTATKLIVSAQHKLTASNESNNNNNSCRNKIYYRVDKDDTLNTYTTPLSNLSKLFQSNSLCDEKLRQSIIHDQSPKFKEISSSVEKSSIPISKLNKVQESAVKRCLEAEDYVMILGMPGSGKSTTIAVVVQALVAAGKSVLLSSYTHSAVDNILMKLVQEGFTSFTRLGHVYRINDNIKRYSAVERTRCFTTTKQYHDYFNSKSVFATTCLGVNHPALLKKRFDYCIVDEASQITQPVCIGAIRLANVFVLVGDHNQLPPLVQSPDAREKGMDVSLFKELSVAHPEAVVTLNMQYRMNESIMSLANALVYNNRMKCGNSSVATGCLHLPNYENLKTKMEQDILEIIKPNSPVVFVNTDTSNFKEELNGKKLINKGEAETVKRIVSSLIDCGATCKDIGIICPYRNQLKVLKESIHGAIDRTDGEVEIETIDKYQGKDKECIIVTFLRSNEQCEVGELLKDWRRINVALTRAKKKLILIGSKKTIVGSEILKSLMNIIEKSNCLIHLKDTRGVVE